MKSTLRLVLAVAVLLGMAAPVPARAADGVVQTPCDEGAFNTVLDSVQAAGAASATRKGQLCCSMSP